MHPRLTETLREAQRLGFFGDRPIDEAIDHATGFLTAVAALVPGGRLIDLGSGGGLPGLVIADARPDLSITLLDRREKRTDFLRRAVRRLDWEHVEVRSDDVRTVCAEVTEGETPPYDAATARGFGPPELTLRLAVALVRSGGLVVISEPPAEVTTDRWDDALLDELRLTSERLGAVRRFVAVV